MIIHNPILAASYSDRIIFMKDIRIVSNVIPQANIVAELNSLIMKCYKVRRIWGLIIIETIVR